MTAMVPRHRVFAAAVAVAGLLACRACPAADAKRILAAAGVKGGLVVHVGCGDGKLTAALRANDSYLVQGLDRDAAKVAADRSDSFSMRGALTDVLVADGGSIFMRQARFDRKLARQETKRQHLFSTSSLLDGAEHNRSYWLLGTGDFKRLGVAYPWLMSSRRKAVAVPYGLMLAFDETNVWGVRRGGRKGGQSAYTVFATPRPDPSDKESLLGDFARRSGRKPASGRSWTAALPMRPRAMIRAGDSLFIGGEVGKGGFLRAVSC